MANFKILIVEDELIVAKDIQHNLERLGYDVIGISSEMEESLQLVGEKEPDVVLMDIMLRNGESGIDIAEAIRLEFKIPVIFLTAYADVATIEKAKKAESYGYILKPFKSVDLQTTIELAIYKHAKELEVEKERDILANYIDQGETVSNDVFVRTSNKLIKLKKEHILYVEALKDYVIVHLKNQKYTLHTTMKDIESKLGNKDFIRIHRSFIIQMDKVESIELPNLRLEGESNLLPIGGSYKDELFSRINMI
jgi:DNA-binding LytR/AlgR family response regulator